MAWGISCGQAEVPGVYADVKYGLCFIDWASKCFYGENWDYFGIEGCQDWENQQVEALEKQASKFKYGLDERFFKNICAAIFHHTYFNMFTLIFGNLYYLYSSLRLYRHLWANIS